MIRHIPSKVPLRRLPLHTNKGSTEAQMTLPKGSSPLSSIADEEDFLDLVIASERVGEWLETIESSIPQGKQKIANTCAEVSPSLPGTTFSPCNLGNSIPRGR